MIHMLKTYIDTHWYREEGATAVEYGILVALIAVAIILAVTAVGDGLRELFFDVSEQVPGDVDQTTTG